MMIPVGLHLIQQSGHCNIKTYPEHYNGLLQAQPDIRPTEDVVSLLKHINMASAIWYAGIDLTITFFSILRKRGKESFYLSEKYNRIQNRFMLGLC